MLYLKEAMEEFYIVQAVRGNSEATVSDYRQKLECFDSYRCYYESKKKKEMSFAHLLNAGRVHFRADINNHMVEFAILTILYHTIKESQYF